MPEFPWAVLCHNSRAVESKHKNNSNVSWKESKSSTQKPLCVLGEFMWFFCDSVSVMTPASLPGFRGIQIRWGSAIPCRGCSPESAAISSRRGIMTKTSSNRKSQQSKKPFQFKTVSFSDEAKPEHTMFPPRRTDPLPFIITQNGKTPSEVSSLIKRTVMEDFVSKEKIQAAHNSVIRRSRETHSRQHYRGRHSIRSRAETEQEHPIEVADGFRSSVPASPSNGAESTEGYTSVENGTLIVFDNGPALEPSNLLTVDNRPPSLLGPLGAGRVDPFDSYPTQYKNNLVTSQLLDHCKHHFPFV